MISIGIKLMLIGMLTVFCVLIIIIYFSKGLILFVNNVLPEKTEKAHQISDDVQEAIHKAIFQITGGKGTITEIKEI